MIYNYYTVTVVPKDSVLKLYGIIASKLGTL